MKRVLKLAAVAAAGLVVMGCGTVNLNKAITGTDCTTREECVKALNLRNPEKADLTFVVKPYEFNVGFKANWGYTEPGTPRRTGDAAYCVADALRQEFGNSKILIGSDHKSNEIFVTINEVRFWGNLHGENCGIKTALSLNGKEYEVNGLKYTGPFRWSHDDQVYKGACTDIAKQIKKFVGENQPAKTGMAGN